MPVKLGTTALLAREAVSELGRRAGVDPQEVLATISARIRRAVPHDASAWTTLDPDTLVLSGALTTDLPRELLVALWDNELHDADVHKLADLARRRVPVAALSELDAVRADGSRRRTEILPRAGIGDELRGLLRAGGVVWGCFALYRAQGAPDFSRDERRFVAGIASDVAVGLRSSLLPSVPAPAAGPPAPGLVLVSADDRLVAATDDARDVMARMPGDPARILRGVAIAAHRRGAAHARVRLTDGRWIVLHAASMQGASCGEEGAAFAVSLVPPARVELTSLMLRLHGLTAREREVAALVIQGRATEEVAERLSITRFTLRDHLKAIYAKVGATHRAELMALGDGC